MHKQFHGDGFNENELSPEERAQIRHMLMVVDKNFVVLETETVEKMEALAGMATALVNIAKITAVAAPLGAAIAFWAKFGGLQ